MPPVSLPDRFHFLRLAKSSLCRGLFRQITDEAVEQVSAASRKRRYAELDLDFPAIAPPRLDLEAFSQDRALPAAQEPRELLLVRYPMLFRNNQITEDLADGVAARPPEYCLGLPVPIDDPAGFIHLNEGIEGGVDDAAGHLLAFEEGLLGLLALGHVPADEEVTLDRFRPSSHPRERHDAAVLVNVARFEIAHDLTATRHAHLRSGRIEIVGMDEFNGAAADHLSRLEPQNCGRARADLNEVAFAIRYQDQVLRRLDDTAALLDLLRERRLRLVPFGDVACNRAGAGDGSGRRLDRRNTERNIDGRTSFVEARGLERIDLFASPHFPQQIAQFGSPIVRHDDVDAAADRLLRAES